MLLEIIVLYYSRNLREVDKLNIVKWVEVLRYDMQQPVVVCSGV